MELFTLGGGRFQIQRKLGTGGMGVVYQAYDSQKDSVVALKTLKRMSPQALVLFKNEFRALADLHHPNLIQLHELFSEGDLYYFTMELLDAQELSSFLRLPEDGPPSSGDSFGRLMTAASEGRGSLGSARTLASGPERKDDAIGAAAPQAPLRARGRCDEASLRAVFGQLAQGLSALHAAGKVHRDLKPSNVMVTQEGRVVLMDFGLVTDSTGDHTKSQLVGTPLYMAPEQAAARVVGPPADWYAIGLMLYEALTGVMPFSGSLQQILLQKQELAIAPPRVLRGGQDIPLDLDGLCQELLARDPAARPRGAEILKKLGADDAAVSSQGLPLVQEIPFVGRARELRALSEALKESRREGLALLVYGESGLGKSALIRHFLDGAGRGAVVLSGRCYEQELVPYKAFDGIVDALSRYLLSLSSVELAGVLPAEAALLARVFPVLRQLRGLGELRAPNIQDPSELRQRVFALLRELLGHLGEQGPLVLSVDDLQWSDKDSLLLLAELLKPPAGRYLLVASARGSQDELLGEKGPLAPLARLEGELRHLSLERLPATEARALVERLCGLRGEEAEALLDEAGGHPLFLQELALHAGRSAQGSSTLARLDDLLFSRVTQLEEAARRLLELVAIAGAPLPQRILGQAASLSAAAFAAQVTKLRTALLVRTLGRQDTAPIEPYHDRVRESVAARLGEGTKRRHHLRLAEALEQNGAAEEDPHALVRHLEAAGEHARAATHARRAAEHAASALAFEQAAELYRSALRLGSHDAASARLLKFRLGEILGHDGRGKEAADLFLEIAEELPAEERLDCQRRALEHLLGSGHLKRGLAVLEGLSSLVGTEVPRTRSKALLALLWQRARLRARGLNYQLREESQCSPEALTRLDIVQAIASGMGQIEPLRGAVPQAQGLLLALHAGEPRRLGQALCIEAVFLSSQNARNRRRGRALVAEARQVAAQSQDPQTLALLPAAEGILDMCDGRGPDAEVKLMQSEQRFQEGPALSAWDLNMIRILRVYNALHLLGRLGVEGRRVDEYLLNARRRGDRFTETRLQAVAVPLFLARDQGGAVRRMLDHPTWLPSGLDAYTSPRFEAWVQLWQLWGRAQLVLYEGESAALEPLSATFQDALGSILLRTQIAYCEHLWLWGGLALGRLTRSDTRARAELQKVLKKLAREGTDYARVWRGLLGAGLAVWEANPRAAILQLQEVIPLAQSQGMELCAAVARRCCGELLGQEGAALLAEANAWMTSQQIKRPERMVELFLPGFCASQWSAP